MPQSDNPSSITLSPSEVEGRLLIRAHRRYAHLVESRSELARNVGAIEFTNVEPGQTPWACPRAQVLARQAMLDMALLPLLLTPGAPATARFLLCQQGTGITWSDDAASYAQIHLPTFNDFMSRVTAAMEPALRRRDLAGPHSPMVSNQLMALRSTCLGYLSNTDGKR